VKCSDSAASTKQKERPLASALFAIALRSVTSELSTLGLTFNVWYLDDGAISGPIANVKAAFDRVMELSSRMGLSLNLSKCELWWPNLALEKVSMFPLEIIRSTNTGTELLGGPIGDSSFIQNYVEKKVNKTAQSISSLKDLDDSQIEFALLRSCVGLPKMAYLLRVVDPDYFEQITVRYPVRV
jgi:hypothetical protein